MLLNFMREHFWATLGVWAVLYVSDYALTLVGASRYRRGSDSHVRFEGSYELNPVFQRDVDRLNKISIRFIVMLIAISAILWVAWAWVREGSLPPPAFDLYCGIFMLPELFVLQRHLKNLYVFSGPGRGSGISGQITYSRPYLLRLPAVDHGLGALLCLALAAMVQPWFFLGGGLGCCGVALNHLILARRAGARAPTAP